MQRLEFVRNKSNIKVHLIEDLPHSNITLINQVEDSVKIARAKFNTLIKVVNTWKFIQIIDGIYTIKNWQHPQGLLLMLKVQLSGEYDE